jgi:hypothetical protein
MGAGLLGIGDSGMASFDGVGRAMLGGALNRRDGRDTEPALRAHPAGRGIRGLGGVGESTVLIALKAQGEQMQ